MYFQQTLCKSKNGGQEFTWEAVAVFQAKDDGLH